MKAKYLLGFFVAMSTTHLSFATTFKIVDFDNAGIVSIAPLYKEKTPVFQPVKTIEYSKKQTDYVRNSTITKKLSKPGIAGTTPFGVTHLKGVAFSIGGKKYEVTFKEEQEPGRLALNVLVEIWKEKKTQDRYFGRLYQNASNADAKILTLDFKQK